MTDRPRPRVAVIDDHPVIAMGLANPEHEIEVVAAFESVEDYLRAPDPTVEVIMLDLQLDQAGVGGHSSGTTAIRLLRNRADTPIVVYTSLIEEMVLAACLAAGATGLLTKQAPPRTIAEVVRAAAQGKTWFDPLVAGAIRRWGDRRHAGALSVQQANALRYRGQGLTQKAIAEKIGVSDPEIVYRYLRAAVEKLAEPADIANEPAGRHPGALADDFARRSGLASDLVRHDDLAMRRPRKRPPRPRFISSAPGSGARC